MSNTLIVGCGDIGFRLARALHQQGRCVTGLRRQVFPQAPVFNVIQADVRQAASLQGLALDYDTLVFIVSPDRRDPESYQTLFHDGLSNLLQHFARAGRMPRCFMVSSTSVYGQQQGEWVNEASVTEPDTATARWLVAAERLLWRYDSGHCVIRFAGIYGPERDWLLRRAASDEAIQHSPPYYTNRIHVDDCVGVLLYLLERHWSDLPLQTCYLASDDEPATIWEVMDWLKPRLGYPPPRAMSGTHFFQQNKRCDNARLKALGYDFLYPGYREGYAELLQKQV